jgi:hypothetical protein
MEVFRERQIETTKESIPEKPAEVTGIVEDKESIPHKIQTDTLEKWEITNGKYGLDYLGIKNIGDTFPLKMHFAVLDKFIKSEIAERGYDVTPESWQNVLKELEGELKTNKLDAYKRLEKLSNYIKVLNRLKALKKPKDSYI